MRVDPKTLSWILFVAVYVGLGVGRLPFVHLDRAGIALVGATAMVVLGGVAFDEAVHAVDFHTLALLFGMMVIVAYLRLGGFFRGLASMLLSRAKSPRAAIVLLVFVSGLLSAFLVNDVVCIALGPVSIAMAQRLRRDPVPYLVALATSANIGSVATITGNPQNMIIGALSKIGYAPFAARLAPVAVVGLLLDALVLLVVFRGSLQRDLGGERASLPPRDPLGEPERRLLVKGVLTLLGVVVAFFAGVPVSLAAMGGAAIVMFSRVKPERINGQIDWNLLVMFAGLFVVVHGFEVHVVRGWDLARFATLPRAPVTALTAVSVVLSNLVSNVPAVLLMKSTITSLADATRESGWLTLAMATTLAGNLSPIASVANLIVLEGARREGIHVSVRAYCAVGIPVTLLTLAAGGAWLTR